MRTIIAWLCAWAAGSLGWWLGQHLGLVAAVILGGVAGAAGLYAGQRWFDQNLK
jgi:hypothetical protein